MPHREVESDVTVPLLGILEPDLQLRVTWMTTRLRYYAFSHVIVGSTGALSRLLHPHRGMLRL